MSKSGTGKFSFSLSVQETPDSFFVRLFVIPVVEISCHPHRISKEKSLVQLLPRPEGTARNIPRQPEEPDSFFRRGVFRLVVPVNIPADFFTLQICLCGQGHEA